MNVERLRAVQAEEREADSLRALPDSFYREVADYVQELRDQRAGAAAEADDPFGSEEVRRLTDEIETAEEVAEAIYERRVGKLVKRASLAAAGMPTDEEGLTAEEAELFADLVAQIEDHRAEVLATFDGDRDAHGVAETAATDELADEAASERADGEEDPTTGLDAGAAMGGDVDGESPVAGPPESEAPPPPPDDAVEEESADRADDRGGAPSDVGDADDPDRGSADDTEESTGGGEAAGNAEREDTERVTLRITRDVGEVFGVDERVYDLASEDVVTLPAANAKPLLDRDAAEEID